jgi:hypothetical protein
MQKKPADFHRCAVFVNESSDDFLTFSVPKKDERGALTSVQRQTRM